jgi:uncharacterized protein (DUF2141 family)
MRIFFILFWVLCVFPTYSQLLTVEISGIKTDKGVILLSIYRDSQTFDAETPFMVYTFDKEKMVDGKMNVSISDLPDGTYGIALIDDENGNGKIDFKFFVPTEGFGFSNYYFKGKRKPRFESFSFQLCEESTTTTIMVQYF